MDKGPKISFPRRGSGGSQYESPKTSDFGIGTGVKKSEKLKRFGIHGIGGGMRVDGDSLLSPSFNRAWMLTRSSLTPVRIFFGVYVAIMIALLSVAHIHLRFTIHDLSIQANLLQRTHRDMKQERDYLLRTNNALSEGGRLNEYAIHTLKMEPIVKGQELAVSPQIAVKYNADARVQARAKVRNRETYAAETDNPARIRGLAKLNSFIEKYIP